MIVSIEGIVEAASPLRVVINVGGLGYEVHIPVTTAERVPGPGKKVKLHTHAVFREDSQALYGFAEVAERDFFRLMIEKVSGIGPKVALSILSHMSLPVLQTAIAGADTASLSKCPGIGKKTAERLVIELRSLVGQNNSLGSGTAGSGITTGAVAGTASSAVADAVLALSALGYKPADADKVVRQASLALGPAATTEALIKKALA